MSIFNRTYRAKIMTSGPRSSSKACFVKKKNFQSHFSRQLNSWFAALVPHSLRGLHVSIAYPAPISWQKRPCSHSHVKHVSVSTAMAFKASDLRHHAVEFIRNPVSSYFHSQVSQRFKYPLWSILEQISVAYVLIFWHLTWMAKWFEDFQVHRSFRKSSVIVG